MHKSRLGNIVIDCQTDDLLAQAKFWSAALGYPLPENLDPTARFISLVAPPGEMQVILQRVSHESRAHLDIETDAIDAEALRLEKLGARVETRKDDWVVMQAPSGHYFCVGGPYRGGFDDKAKRWE